MKIHSDTKPRKARTGSIDLNPARPELDKKLNRPHIYTYEYKLEYIILSP